MILAYFLGLSCENALILPMKKMLMIVTVVGHIMQVSVIGGARE